MALQRNPQPEGAKDASGRVSASRVAQSAGVHAVSLSERRTPADPRSDQGGRSLDARREEEPGAEQDVHRLRRVRRRAYEVVERRGERVGVDDVARALREPEALDVAAHELRRAAARILAQHALRAPPLGGHVRDGRLREEAARPASPVAAKVDGHQLGEPERVEELVDGHTAVRGRGLLWPALSVQSEQADGRRQDEGAAQVERLRHRARQRGHLVVE
eukprot:CAMPEP_0195602468 /NCGR_PEP_ID=MMETSP0815-20121206/5619_1 /TAXON_ID=97485 /ORGANISM="Prymnesium parvum, Strain Texoma1" /LENGTH=218 /DNA_ID=CAMNT_0040742047 /DNA_START=355 /DNA_END=1009 /DNA_ORIENTATION=+